MSGNARESGRSTIDRLLSLLDVFDGGDLTLAEVSERSGLPLTTTHRMLAALEQWGGVEREVESGGYRVGMRLWELGTRATGPSRLRELALPIMQDLYESTHQNVQLAVLDHGTALVIERLTGRRAVRTATEVGGRLPLHATGVGKALLASSPATLHALTSRRLTRYTPHTLVMPGALAAAVERARATSLAYSREEMTLGAASLATTVDVGHESRSAAIGIVTHSRVDLARYEGMVHRAGRSLSRAMREDDAGEMSPLVRSVEAVQTHLRRSHQLVAASRRTGLEHARAGRSGDVA